MLKGGFGMLKALKKVLKWLVCLVKSTNEEFPEQWSKEVREKMEKQKKPPLKINIVKSTNVGIKGFHVVETIVEKHIIKGKSVRVKKAYILESMMQPTDDKSPEMKRWLKLGLKAKKILKYQKDECNFRWVVWYI